MSLPSATFALGVDGGRVVEAPPYAWRILRRIGQDEQTVADYFRARGAVFRDLQLAGGDVTDGNDRVRIGGLMRCCTETVGDLYPDGPARVGTEGQVLQCKYAPDDPLHRMIFRDGAWEWLKPDDG